jgi:hypothetical protein
MKSLLLSTLLFLSFVAKAQFTCIDSGRVNPMFQCNMQFYDPVCGCNNITYRNQCNAYNNYGVVNWRSGVCAGIDMDFYPNPVGPSTTLTINLSHPEFINANADVKIVDMYGKTWEHRIINNFNRMTIQFDVTTLKTGVYLIVLTSSLNTSMVRMLAKY